MFLNHQPYLSQSVANLNKLTNINLIEIVLYLMFFLTAKEGQPFKD